MRGAVRVLVVAVGVSVLLAGCVRDDGIPALPPSPSATPIFASEEEALAAAEAAYAAYSEVANAIANEGGAEPERIAPYVTAEQLEKELASARYLSDRGLHVEGPTVVAQVELQQYNESDDGAEVAIYVCADVSLARARDATGADVTPADRPDVIALEVVLRGASSDHLLVASSEQWSDSEFCS